MKTSLTTLKVSAIAVSILLTSLILYMTLRTTPKSLVKDAVGTAAQHESISKYLTDSTSEKTLSPKLASLKDELSDITVEQKGDTANVTIPIGKNTHFESKFNVKLTKTNDGWKIISSDGANPQAVKNWGDLLNNVTKAIESNDSSAMHKLLTDKFCKNNNCTKLLNNVANGKRDALLNEILPKQSSIVKASPTELAVMQATPYLNQNGVVVLHQLDGKLNKIDDTNYQDMSDLMESWVENYFYGIEERKSRAIIGFKSLDPFCAQYLFYSCYMTVIPNEITNKSDKKIKSLTYSKARAGRYLGNATRSFTTYVYNLNVNETISTASLNDCRKHTIKSNTLHGERQHGGWDIYRIENVTFSDDTKFTFNPQDYHKAYNDTVTIAKVLSLRKELDYSNKEFNKVKIDMETLLQSFDE